MKTRCSCPAPQDSFALVDALRADATQLRAVRVRCGLAAAFGSLTCAAATNSCRRRYASKSAAGPATSSRPSRFCFRRVACRTTACGGLQPQHWSIASADATGACVTVPGHARDMHRHGYQPVCGSRDSGDADEAWRARRGARAPPPPRMHNAVMRRRLSDARWCSPTCSPACVSDCSATSTCSSSTRRTCLRRQRRCALHEHDTPRVRA